MSDWINVKDKLPAPGTTVLAYTNANRIVIRKFCKNKFSEMTDNITHWMPLPYKPNDVYAVLSGKRALGSAGA
jgi:hypothetical protein